MNLLDISDGTFNPPSIGPISKEISAGFKVFTSINMSSSKIDKFGARVISANILQESNSSVLKHFNLSNNPICGEGMKSLSESLSKINLESLNLSKCSLGVSGALGIKNLINSSATLKTLIATANKFKVEGARVIAKGIEETKTLELIDLSSNIIRDKGMKAITEAIYECPSLKIVSVKNNDLKDEAFNELIKNHMGHQDSEI